MRVRELHIFPVKSCGGFSTETAELEPWGLRDDRRWMVVDPAGEFLTQRSTPAMARLRATMTGTGLALAAAGFGTIDVSRPGGDAEPIEVMVWKDNVAAVLAADAAHAWVSAVLGQACRLVHLRDPRARRLRADYAEGDETVSFADAFPVLLTSVDSLADLNRRMRVPVPIDRFRGNIVVQGAPPWAEDMWRIVRIGRAVLHVVKPCDRCIVTTTDQATGERPDKAEPLRALARFRRTAKGVMFGQNLVPRTLSRIAVGDVVEVLESGPTNVQTLLETEA